MGSANEVDLLGNYVGLLHKGGGGFDKNVGHVAYLSSHS